jgi:hypothetical protein
VQAFGQRKVAERDMEDIALYHHARIERDGEDALGDVLDDRTWTDLDLDLVFEQVDRCESAVGQQYLYHLLRTPSRDTRRLDDFDELVDRLTRDGGARTAIAKLLERLNRAKAFYLPNLFLLPLPWRPPFRWLYPLLTFLAVASVAGIFVIPQMLFVAIALFAVNIGIEMTFRRRIYEYVRPLRVLDTLIRTGRAISEIPLVRERFPQLAADVAALRPLTRSTVWLSLEREGFDDPMTILWQYLNMFFLADVNAFAASFAVLEEKRDVVERVFNAIGTLDSAISVASFREGAEFWSRPLFTARAKALDAIDAVHPIIAEPVPNTIQIANRSALVTGSNMSGKTTFLRTIGVNAVLAQSIATTLTRGWRAPLLRVLSSIGRGDDLSLGKSYYLAEVERVGALVRDSGGEVQHLFVIDEIFRGTNTTERIAASRGVLAYLNRGDDLVFVATHDVELIDLLGDAFESHHFRELIDGDELRFDYRIQPGRSSTRNAIALLELMKFPQEVVETAKSTVKILLPRSGGEGARSADEGAPSPGIVHELASDHD